MRRIVYVFGVFALLTLQALPAGTQAASSSQATDRAASAEASTSKELYSATSQSVDSRTGAVGEDGFALTQEQLESCYTLYMPASVHEDEQKDAAEADDESLAQGEDVSEEVEVAFHTYDAGSVIINELVSDPLEGEEWVELFNASSDAVDLSGWSLVEGGGKSTNLPEQILNAGEYLVVTTIAGNLNNGGDSLILLDGVTGEIDAMSYGEDVDAPGKGESLALTRAGTWVVTTQMTPGSQNPSLEPQENLTEESYENVQSDDATAINGTNSQDEYETVSDTEPERTGEDDVVSDASRAYLEGVITAVPGTFGSQIAFLDGIQLYFYHADWPELSVGDVVQVSGEPSTAYEESRVKISDRADINVIGSQELAPEAMSVVAVFDQDLGSLVKVSGEVIGIDGKTLTLSDATGEIEIIANERTNMSWSDLTQSAYTITGVVRTRGGKTTIYARDWNDVEVLGGGEAIVNDVTDEDLAGLTSTDDDVNWIGAIVVGVSGGTLVYWFVKFKALPEALAQQTTEVSSP